VEGTAGAAVHLPGKCSHCGQKVRVHRSLAASGHDIMRGVLHLVGLSAPVDLPDGLNGMAASPELQEEI
jgi:hypothetical protein